MNFSNNSFSIEQAKAIDLINYLKSLGFEPEKIRHNDYWYLSPFRDEKEASFKINRRLNRWYDHGLGKGGNLIDFGIEFYKCSLPELLRNLSGNLSLQQPLLSSLENSVQQEPKIKIVEVNTLTSYSLLRYLEQRTIPVALAQQFCKEVHYSLNDKTYYGIGFKNDLGGYEIRNPYFKTTASPKGITTFENGSNEVVVFEGFFDYLSFKAMTKNLPENSQDFVILNSVSFFERARLFMENHESIRLYFDQDETGQSYTKRALSLSTKYKDESTLYRNYKDLNDWSVNFGKSKKNNLRHKNS
ncbi:toprim domain-containing protein [Flavobacterium sp. PL002]|uniref:toprim domain-containing protein n=1 Tax=Flavobacterium sp. PL002 TaxID=1897058 RepID=UPI001788216D|nr:toprim domain-containing protein [Flavobacterium sp. PL002]MBE0392472.1 DNA primase [Flavobacterium sp. PL002]